MRSRSGAERERGSVTAEFAAVVPAVILLLACALVCVQLGAQQVMLQDAAADAARGLGRGDPLGSVAARLDRQVPGATLASWADGDLTCVRVEVAPAGPVAALGLRAVASSCALREKTA